MKLALESLFSYAKMRRQGAQMLVFDVTKGKVYIESGKCVQMRPAQTLGKIRRPVQPWV